MYLRRKIDKYLSEWLASPDKKPLIIKGARQVGKTASIRRFAHDNYKSLVEVNFVTHPDYKMIIENGYSAAEIIKLISLLDPSETFIPGETLIFFDEVQDFPEIATSLKFFKEDGRFDVICSGSLLGVNYKSIDSISVGYKTDYDMRSMDFEEFLWANGYGNDTVNDMLEHMLSDKPFLDIELKKYSELFLNYSVLGGMPEIVASYIENGSFEGSLRSQRQLLRDYEADIRKYSEGLDQARIMSVWRSVPSQLAKENKKFQYRKVREGGRASDYIGCIDWIKDAGLVNICNCLNYPELPLKGNANTDKFKLYMADTGLLVAGMDDEAQKDLRANRNLGVYKGALYENFASEALAKQGYDLYYYKRDNSTLEIDFFVRTESELVPIEIKAGNDQAKSMRELIISEKYPDIKCGIKFIAGNTGRTDTVYTFPHFCLFLLNRFIESGGLNRPDCRSSSGDKL